MNPKLHIVAQSLGLLLATFWVLGCKAPGNPTGEIMVPLDANIPFFDRAHIQVSRAATQVEIGALPAEALRVRAYLSDPAQYVVDTLEFAFAGPLQVVGVGEDRLAILDGSSDHLVEYDRGSGLGRTVAARGQAPGELSFSKALVGRANTIYAIRADRVVSVFDCDGGPCRFERSLRVALEASAGTPVGTDSLALLGGLTPVAKQGVQLDDLPVMQGVHVVDSMGSTARSFARTYETEGHWMLFQPFIFDGSISHFEAENLFGVAFDRFPILYVYDTAGNLTSSYFFSEFIVGRQEYSTETGSLKIVLADHSLIATQSITQSGGHLLVEISTRTNSRVEDFSYVWDIRRDYYFLNLSSQESHYLGYLPVADSNVDSRLILIPGGLALEAGGRLMIVHNARL